MPATRDDLTEIRRIAQEMMADLWTAVPGYVSRVHEDLGSQYVDVTPVVGQALARESGIELALVPTIPAVPLAPWSLGGFYVLAKPAVGDAVLVVVSKLPIDQWLRNGKIEPGHVEQSAEDATGEHALTNAMAFPLCPRPVGSTLPDAPSDELVIGVVGADSPRLTMAKSGTFTMKGSLHVTGNVTGEGDVSADGEVTAKAANPATSVTVSGHSHFDAMGTTQPPTPGT